MAIDQIFTLFVLAAVVVALIVDKMRADVVALTGAAALLLTGVVRPVEVQSAFASPAIIALAALFVMAYALEVSGLLDRAIDWAVRLCRRMGSAGLWLLMGLCGAASAFLNNTPIVILSAPVVRDVATTLNLSPRRYLMPLSYITVMGGCCTLIGTSTNLLVNDMARVSGQPSFGMFEILPVGLAVTIVGGLYLFFVSGRLLREGGEGSDHGERPPLPDQLEIAGALVGKADLFKERQPFAPVKAAIGLGVFVGAITLATFNVVPIASTALGGVVLLILLGVITPDQAYSGLKPEILVLIAGMVVIGIAMEESGLAADATEILIGSVDGLEPLTALIVLYVVTLILTELLSNATVAVLVTPIAVALAESLGVSPRPFLIAVMLSASAAFATPFGYQTNVIVYQMAGYSYMDFVRVGLPLNMVTAIAAIFAIQAFFPF
jgi:di/tricarboxylate transporter